jgi:hypothetical protein
MADTTEDIDPEPGLQSASVNAPAEPHPPHRPPSSAELGRIAWLITTVGLAIGVVILLLKREWGYAAVSGAVAVSAAINLF